MARYGYPKYGTFKYGDDQSTGVYYSSNITSWSYDYSSIYIAWGRIVKPADDPTLTHWKLVKNYGGTPDNPENGVILSGDVYSNFEVSYLDASVEDAGLQVNYSLWVYNGTNWLFCGSTYAINVYDDGSLTKVLKWIPKAWTNPIDGISEAVGEAETNDFTKILSAYVYKYDYLRTETNLLKLTSDPAQVHNSILEKKVTDLGFEYEPSLGDSYHRSLYKSGNFINSAKGTSSGISAYVTALTHLKSSVEVGHNLLLDYNDSSFEESTGNWTVDPDFTFEVYEGSSYTPPTPNVFSSNTAPRTAGYGLLSTSSTSPVILSLPDSTLSPILYGIPVTENTNYVFSGWVKSLDDPGTVTAKISWYDGIGNLISTTSAGSSVTTSTAWSEVTSISTTGRSGVTSPNNAIYARCSVTITPSTSDANRYQLDMFQLAKAEHSFEFEDARKIKVILYGQDENYIPNPVFQNSVSNWDVSNNAYFMATDNPHSNAIYYGQYAAQLSVTSTGQAYISSDWMYVDPGQLYNFSAYVSSATYSGDVIARIEYSNRESFEKQIAILSDVDGQYFDSTVYYADSDPVELTSYEITHTITNAVGNGTNVTFTTANTHNLSVDEYVTISGILVSTGYNLSGVKITAVNPTLKTFTVVSTVTGSYGSGGVATVVENIAGYPTQVIPERKKVSVSAITPQYSKDSGFPLARVSLYYPDAAAGDVIWHSAALLQDNGPTVEFFCGSGAPIPADPLVNANYFSGDCVWETKTIQNYISNPSFEETIDDWTEGSGTTLTSTATLDAGSLVSVTKLEFPDKAYADTSSTAYLSFSGDYVGEVGLTSGEGSVSTTVYLPRPAIGGEDFVVSAYVQAAEGTYVISTSGGGVTSSSSYPVLEYAQYQWTRIVDIRTLKAGETSFTLNIEITAPTTYSFDPTDAFYLDGVMAEYGRTPSRFVNSADPSVSVSKPNPGNPSTSMWLSKTQSVNSGKSSYFSNYAVKYSRLYTTLPLVMPYGSSWEIVPGNPTQEYMGELTESLIPSASFEKDLGSWSGVNSTLTRIYSKGSLAEEFVVQGSAYCNVLTSRTSGSGTFDFGITTANIPVFSNTGYYASVAIRPANSNSTGDYTLSVKFYSANGTLISTKTSTAEITNLTRWAYIAVVAPANDTDGAAYAVYSVDFNPAVFNAAQAFHIDRAVFRR